MAVPEYDELMKLLIAAVSNGETYKIKDVTAIVDGKHIPGNPNEILEVKNTYDTYFQPYQECRMPGRGAAFPLL